MRVQKEKIRSGRKGNKRFKGEGGERECCSSRGEPDGPSSTVEICKLKESEEEVTVLVVVGYPKKVGTQQGWPLQE